MLEVARVFKTPANGYIPAFPLFSAFQYIHLGCCTVAAHRLRSTGFEPAHFSSIVSLFRDTEEHGKHCNFLTVR